MPSPSTHPVAPDIADEKDKRIQALEATISDMREFEVMLLNLNRCFLEAVHSSNSDLMQNVFVIHGIVDAVCGIRYEFEKGLLTNGKKKEAFLFLFQQSQRISTMLKIQEDLLPLKKLIAKLQELLSQDTIC